MAGSSLINNLRDSSSGPGPGADRSPSKASNRKRENGSMKVSPNKMRPVVAKRRMKKYLEVLAKTGNKTRAREDARLSHRKLDRLKEEYPEFEQAEQKALMDYVAILETEADRRAVEGVAEPVYYEGEIVGTKQKFSDPLLMFRLKGLYPDRYKDRVENSGQASGATINLYLPENGRK